MLPTSVLHEGRFHEFSYLCPPEKEVVMKIKNLEFGQFIAEATIMDKVKALAVQLNHDYQDRSPVFLPVLLSTIVDTHRHCSCILLLPPVRMPETLRTSFAVPALQ